MTETLTYNAETELGLRIQLWALDTPVNEVVERVTVIAQAALPMLREALNAELGEGLRVQFDDVAAERRASCHFVLELILGTLDPALVWTPIGDRLRDRLRTIAEAAGLDEAKFRVREASDARLMRLFGTLLA